MVTLNKKYIYTVNVDEMDTDITLKTSNKKALYLQNAVSKDITFNASGNDLKIIINKDGGEHTITLKDYIKKNGRYSYKYIMTGDSVTDKYIQIYKGERVAFMDIINDEKVKNPINTPNKKGVVNGTVFNDIINVSDYTVATTGRSKNKGVTIYGGNGSDEITGSVGNDRIYGGNGNDIIYGTAGNDVISGGNGVNTIKYTSLDQLSGDEIYLTKGENLTIDISEIEGTPSATYSIKGRDMVVTVSDGEESKDFVIKNFGTRDITDNHTRRKADTSSVELKFSDTGKDNLKEVAVNAQSGTWHNDIIDASTTVLKKTVRQGRLRDSVEKSSTDAGLTLKGGAGDDVITGTQYSDKIYGGNGDDIITGGAGNDTITGGTGNDTLIFKGDFGNDTVNLAKGENVKLDFSSFTNVTKNDLKYEVVKNDIKITVQNPTGGTYGTVLIKNFAKSDVVGKNGSVTLQLAGENNIVNLNTDNILTFTKDNFRRNSFTSYRLSETIDATGLTSATIKAKEGNNTIISTDGGTDKITTGNGNNNIILKSGDKTVATGSGDDTIEISGDGTRTINTGSGKNTITVNNSNAFGDVTVVDQKANTTNNIIFTSDIGDYYLTKDGNDISFSGDNSTFTVKGYFNDKNHNNVQTIFSDNTQSYSNIEELMNKFKGFAVQGSGTINGTDYNDVILADNKNSKITAGKGDDVINAGKGTNKIYFRTGDGNDTIKDGGGVDTLIFDKGTDVTCSIDKDNNLTIQYGDGNDSISVSGYSKDHSVKYIQVGNHRNDVSDYIKLHSPTDIPEGMEASPSLGTYNNIRGTSGDDVLIGTANNDSIKGRAGNDVIYGGYGDDYISGGDGDDKIYGGKGNDRLSGGNGHNTFYFADGDGSDIISEPGVDNTLFFYGIKDISDLTLKAEKQQNKDIDLIISGYGDSDNVRIKTFIAGDSNYTYSYTNYKLQAPGADTTSLYDAVYNSKDISNEIKAAIAGFVSSGKDTGIDAQSIAQASNNALSAETLLTTGTTTPQM